MCQRLHKKNYHQRFEGSERGGYTDASTNKKGREEETAYLFVGADDLWIVDGGRTGRHKEKMYWD